MDFATAEAALQPPSDGAGDPSADGGPAPAAGASALGGAGRPGQVTQFKNIFSQIRDKFDPVKKAERKQQRADNRAALDTARDDATTGAGAIAGEVGTDLKKELVTFVEGQLGGDAERMKEMHEEGRRAAIAKMGGRRTEIEREDAAEYVAKDARKSALGGKAEALADAKLTATVTDALLDAAKKGFDETSGSGDETALVDKAKVKAKDLAQTAADAQGKIAKKRLTTELEANKATIDAELKASTTAGVRTRAAREELHKRHKKDAKVEAALQGVLDTPMQQIEDAVVEFLKHKLGADGVGALRSKELKDFRQKMKVAARDQAKTDVGTEAATTTETAELEDDATKRSRKGAKASMKVALGELAKDGLTHVKNQDDPEGVLKMAGSKAAWGAIRARDGRDGKAEAEAAVLAAAPQVKAKSIETAHAWRNDIVKAQTNIAEAEAKVKAQVTDDEVGKHAVDASRAKKGDVDAVVAAVVPPAEKEVLEQITKHLKHAIGAKGAGWWRSDQVRDFRAGMKKAGRKQAYDDLDTAIGTNTTAREATKAYMGVAGRDVAYDKAKGSVNAQMKEFAKAGAAEALTNAQTTAELSKVARAAAFKSYRSPSEEPDGAARSAATHALRAAIAVETERAMTKAEAWKADLFSTGEYQEDDGTGTGGTQTANAKEKVKKKVETDHVGERSLKQALKANTTAEGMAAIGRLADLAAPNRGDSAKLEVELRIPVPNSPAFVKLHVVAEAERGVTTRKNGAPPGGVDAKSLKVGAQFNVGGGVDLWGLRLDGTIGFFVRAQAMDTQKTFQALNYGAYRSACQINNGMADWWGGSGKSKSKDTSTTPPGDSDGGHKKTATERAELWAAMVEENVFMRKNPHYDPTYTGPFTTKREKRKRHEYIPDEAAFVDIGGGLNAKGKLKAALFEGEASARGELFAHYDGDVIKRAIKRAQNSGKVGSANIGLAKAGTTEQEAKDRRTAIKPKTGGGLTIETKLACQILGQAVEFAAKGTIGNIDGWGVEIAAGLKFDNASPTDFSKIANGIVSSGASALRTLVGLYQNTQDKNNPDSGQTPGEQVNKGIGSFLDAGSDAENIIDTASGGILTTALGNAYKVSAAKSDQVNETVSDKFDELTGQSTEDVANEAERAGVGSEVMLQVVISIGPGQCHIQIKQVKVRKVAVDLGSAALDVSIEKQKRLAQIGMVDGRFHAEGLGFGTSRKNT